MLRAKKTRLDSASLAGRSSPPISHRGLCRRIPLTFPPGPEEGIILFLMKTPPPPGGELRETTLPGRKGDGGGSEARGEVGGAYGTRLSHTHVHSSLGGLGLACAPPTRPSSAKPEEKHIPHIPGIYRSYIYRHIYLSGQP